MFTSKHCFSCIHIHFFFGCSWSSFVRGLFSSCRESVLRSSCALQAAHCNGFSYCGALALGHMGSVVATLWLSCSSPCGIF